MAPKKIWVGRLVVFSFFFFFSSFFFFFFASAPSVVYSIALVCSFFARGLKKKSSGSGRKNRVGQVTGRKAEMGKAHGIPGSGKRKAVLIEPHT